MLKHNERWVLFYGQHLRTTPEDPKSPDIPLRDIITLLLNRQTDGNCVKLINNETAAIRITDTSLDVDNNALCLLIQYADKNASDPVFSNLMTGELRVEPKLLGEGVAVSAHMMISLTPQKNNPSEYLTLLEDVPGIGKTMIEHFLTSEFKEVSDFVFEDDKNRVRQCRPIVKMEGHMSQTLQESLERGHLQGFELVRYGKRVDFDEFAYTTDVTYTANIKCVQTGGGGAVDLIKRVSAIAKKKKYTEMRVRYKRPEGRTQTVSIPTGREDAINTLFTRMDLIKVRNPLPQCSPLINEEVLGKLKGLLIASR